MTGSRAIAGLPLRDARGGAAGWFNVSVHPLAGRSGYSFWRLQDITARHEMEEVIRDEQNKLVDFLDNAPIGFYSVDGDQAASSSSTRRWRNGLAARPTRSSTAGRRCRISSAARWRWARRRTPPSIPRPAARRAASSC